MLSRSAKKAPWRRTLFAVPPVLWVFLAMLLISIPVLELYGRAGGMSWAFLSNMLERSVTLGIVAIGQTFVVLVASIDLSVGYVISLAAVLASFIMQGDPIMIAAAIPFILLLGMAIGTVNGLLVTRLDVNPLIATLGVGLIIQGILSTSFQNFAGSVPVEYQQLAYGRPFGIPAPVFLLLILVAVASYVLHRTRFGAHMYAVGGNRQAARLAGIRTANIIIGAHMVTGLMAAAAGLFLVGRLGSGAPWVGSDGIYDLESIAAAVVGGTLLAGGKGGILGTLAGVLILGFIDSLFNQLGVDPYLKQVLRGAIIIVAVAAYSIRSREEVA